MWGNVQGWVIAGVLAAATVIAAGWVVTLGPAEPSDFSTTHAVVLADAALPVDPRTVVAFDTPGDAGPLYRRAIDAFRADREAYEKIERLRSTDSLPRNLEAFGLLHEARPLARMRLFETTPEQLVEYRAGAEKHDELDDLVRLGQLACALALRQSAAGQHEQALELASDAFALGAKLYEERVTFAQAQAGLTLMAEAGELIRLVAEKRQETDLAARAEAFGSARRSFKDTQLQPVWLAINSPDNRLIAKHAGDMLLLATGKTADGGDIDRMWQVEAVRKVGRLKWHVGVTGLKGAATQQAARGLLEEIKAQAEDPVVKTAAEHAAALDLPAYNRL